MKNKDDEISYKISILGLLVLLNLFIIFDFFSSNPLLEALLGHIPFFVILLPSSILIIILSYTTYKSLKVSKKYSKNVYINYLVIIPFALGLLILGIFILFFLILTLISFCPISNPPCSFFEWPSF